MTALASITRVYTEIEVAYALGFKTIREFQKAQKDGYVPPPDYRYPDGDRWLNATLDPLLNPDGEARRLATSEQKIIDRIRRGENAPPPPSKTARR